MRQSVLVHKRAHVNMCIPLSGRKPGMAEHFLDGAQVGAGRQKMGRKAVPERMRGYFLADSRPEKMFLKRAGQGARRKPTAGAI